MGLHFPTNLQRAQPPPLVPSPVSLLRQRPGPHTHTPMEGLVIIETDVNRETMVVWSYPGITGTPLEAALTAQAEVVCGPAAVEAAKQPGRKPSTAYFTKHGATWAYG